MLSLGKRDADHSYDLMNDSPNRDVADFTEALPIARRGGTTWQILSMFT
jgi:hypothetical protein